jgi:uncharacterized membrane protein
MPISFDNLDWMFFNTMLAVIPVLAGLLTVLSRRWYMKVVFGIVWLLFVPNTIYILTDIKHIPFNMSRASSGFDLMLLFLQYVVFVLIGIYSFLFAVYPIEHQLLSYRNKKHTFNIDIFLFILNFIIAFGVVLGRIQRTNSWEVFTNFEKVVMDVMDTLSSFQLVLFVIVFGVIANTLYFLLRDQTAKILSSFLPKIRKK